MAKNAGTDVTRSAGEKLCHQVGIDGLVGIIKLVSVRLCRGERLLLLAIPEKYKFWLNGKERTQQYLKIHKIRD